MPGTLPTECRAKSYSVEAIQIHAVVNPDGSMNVTERITYEFDGKFSYAFREIPTRPGQRLVDFVIEDSGRKYTTSYDEQPGTFTVTSTEGLTKVTWYYSAKDERRTFVFSYTIKGVVDRYPDTAELYFKFVGEGWDRVIRDVSVRVQMPEGVESSDLRAWAHGPLHGTVRILPRAVVSLDVSPLPARTYWEARVLSPPGPFSGVPLASQTPRVERILAEEAAWAEEANRRREARQRWLEEENRRAEQRAALARRYLPISVAIGLLGIGVWFVMFRRYGWPHPVTSRIAPGEIPSDHPPAVISYLLQRTVSGPSIVATLLDLANRGYLQIQETARESRGWFGKKKTEMDYCFETTGKEISELDVFERDLIEFVLQEAGDHKSFTMSGLKAAASKKRSRFQKWFRKWVRAVGEQSKTYGFFEPYPVRAMVMNVACGLVVAALGVVMSVKSESAAGVPAIVLGGVQAVFTVLLNRRTVEGRRLHLGWGEFRKHLKTVGKALGPVTLDSQSWGRYLAAAIIFGMHRELIPKLQLADQSGAIAYPVWFYSAHGGGLDQSFSSLADGFSTMIDSVSTTVSSASGVGGGASAGGGGGSGGGGGGAG